MAPATTIELRAVRERRQATWASGDYSELGAAMVPIAEALADAADLRAGTSLLDVACGSGNMAIAAARLGCIATGVDYVGPVLERAGARAAAEGLDVAFAWAD